MKASVEIDAAASAGKPVPSGLSDEERAERAYPKLIQYNDLPKGGHFAAWEQPQLLTEEIRSGFRSLRN